ncbi:hypothetical protein WKR88_15010 [Trinickia caryophylli]|uniref:Uncharacterized protein n=1 Tax=Trinickia caryophylli TaxID=28094 RepID=A0A1X7D773_TRICW|nr:hypothetical protein [Trinickia caryophylli]PMS12653.1 hypothetical protein C0Z17_07400 [Trinickia caryophylli]TRX15059.1 hypothetical protein FNF07_28080 [Trinickia caryophylli]WQE14918.1 hypothetical protein U0034_20405 [Trinickia caryophylli]SMF10150.1 hypothetical protein SAMN06295900_102482 [Trinickia caryophylli]GLU31355.1 hypothetical protein Busp01_11970 [Trinickia caryophylli]
MSDSPTLAIDSISAVELTPDGQYLVVLGNAGTAAVHRSLFDHLLVALPHAIELSNRLNGGTAQKCFALHCHGWEIGRLDGTDHLVVRFQLNGNAGISFSVPRDQVPYMVQALCAAAGLPLPEPATLAAGHGATLQ